MKSMRGILGVIGICIPAYGEWGWQDRVLGDLVQRMGFSLYVSEQQSISRRSEFLGVSYDLSHDFTINAGVNLATPKQISYLDLSINNPWTVFSWRSSIDLGVGSLTREENRLEVSQGLTIWYPIDDNFTVQFMVKRFSHGLSQNNELTGIIAMGLGASI